MRLIPGIKSPVATPIILLLIAVAASAVTISPSSGSRRLPEVSDEATRPEPHTSEIICSSDLSALQIFLHEQFGVTEESITQESVDHASTATDFLNQHIELSERPVRRMSLDDFVAARPHNTQPAVIVAESGHAAVVTCVLTDDHDRVCLQILESRSRCCLETVERLQKAGFREAWICDSGSADVEFQVGGATAMVDRLLIPMGRIKPASAIPATFRIFNTGTQPIVIGRIRPSCGCTSVSPMDEIDLEPGALQEFQVEVSSGDSGSCVHYIELSLFEKGTGQTSSLRVTLCGTVLNSFTLAPGSLDFGTLDGLSRDPATRVIRFTESDSDRFEIISVTAQDSPLDLRWHRTQPSDGSRGNYVVIAECRPEEMEPGDFQGEITVRTTSVRRERAVIPYRGTVRSNFDVIPGVTAFGIVSHGSEEVRQIVITPETGVITDSSVVTVPEWATCSVDTSEERVTVGVTANTQTAGYHFGKLTLNLTSDVCSEEITIPCSVFIREEKGLN